MKKEVYVVEYEIGQNQVARLKFDSLQEAIVYAREHTKGCLVLGVHGVSPSESIETLIAEVMGSD